MDDPLLSDSVFPSWVGSTQGELGDTHRLCVYFNIYQGKKHLYFHTDIMVWNAAKCVDLKLILEKYDVHNSIGALWKSQADV